MPESSGGVVLHELNELYELLRSRDEEAVRSSSERRSSLGPGEALMRSGIAAMIWSASVIIWSWWAWSAAAPSSGRKWRSLKDASKISKRDNGKLRTLEIDINGRNAINVHRGTPAPKDVYGNSQHNTK